MNEQEKKTDAAIQTYIRTQQSAPMIPKDYDAYVDQQIWRAKKKEHQRRRYVRVAVFLMVVSVIYAYIPMSKDNVAFASGYITENINAVIYRTRELLQSPQKEGDLISVEEGKVFVQKCIGRIYGLEGTVVVTEMEGIQSSTGTDEGIQTTYQAIGEGKTYEVCLDRENSVLNSISCLEEMSCPNSFFKEQELIWKMYQIRDVAENLLKTSDGERQYMGSVLLREEDGEWLVDDITRR